jgi:hypothetical protein
MHVYCDESGNTGSALLDPEQPIFSLASTSIEPELARDLLAPLLRQGQKEAKYAKLKGTPRGQSQLIDLFSSSAINQTNCKFTLADKKFYLISHLVDKLIEPPLHEAAIDLYAADAHVRLANIWYFGGDLIFPNGGWRAVQVAFLNAIRRCNASSFREFDATLTKAAADVDQAYRDFATGLLLARGRLEEFIGVFRDVEAFDPAVDSFTSLICKWMAEHSERFPVTHDQSKPLRHNEKLLRAFMSDASCRVIGYGNRQHELPLRISTLEFKDSQCHAALQLADLIAGAAADYSKTCFRKAPLTNYHRSLLSVLHPLYVGGMLPSIEPDPVEPPKPNECSLPDGSARFLAEVGYFGSEHSGGAHDG